MAEGVNVNVTFFHPALEVKGTEVLVKTVPPVDLRSTLKLPETWLEGGLGKR